MSGIREPAEHLELPTARLEWLRSRFRRVFDLQPATASFRQLAHPMFSVCHQNLIDFSHHPLK